MPTSTRRWRCVVCGYVHEGDGPPDVCPICAAGPEDFLETGPEAEARPGPPVRVVIVGGGIAGAEAAKRARQASERAEITLFSGEAEPPYQRINLTRYVAGAVARETLPIHPVSWYEDHRIRLERGAVVETVSLEEKTVTPRGGCPVAFDRLILATGARPWRPPVPGLDLDGVIDFRELPDADAILERAGRGDRCVVVGGGILGLETAAGLAARGTAVTVLETAPWLMPRQLDERSARRLEAHVRSLGIELRTGVKLAEIAGAGGVAGVRLADGTEIPAELVVIAAGIRPDVRLARDAGLEVRDGIVVDGSCRTSHPDVLAAGDVAEHAGRIHGLWGPAQRQGAVAGLNAVGGEETFAALPAATSLKVLDRLVFSVGFLAAERSGDVDLWGEDEDRSYRILARDRRIVGAVVIGDRRAARSLRRAVESGRDVPELGEGEALRVVAALAAR